MALFGTKKTKKEAPKTRAPRSAGEGKAAALAEVLARPRITEKATDVAERHVYVFDVSPRANKPLVKEAVEHFFQVTPRKVSVLSVPKKRKTRRGIAGASGGGKKAYVYLHKGDKIELI